MECSRCGSANPQESKFCNNCGLQLTTASTQTPSANAQSYLDQNISGQGWRPLGDAPTFGTPTPLHPNAAPSDVTNSLPTTDLPGPTYPSEGKRILVTLTIAFTGFIYIITIVITAQQSGPLGLVTALVGLAIMLRFWRLLLNQGNSTGTKIRATIDGQVRDLKLDRDADPNAAGGRKLQEWTFVIERYHEGARLTPIPVVMRGWRLTGVLSEGDNVRVDASKKTKNNTLEPKRILNLTTDSYVIAE